ncbi:hypothetical protein Glove_232g74 [Diversispora epigaea]|uniref:Uncharacterized protein n=1 Tax=Diversispora epigaea TaxID=1348612 RepID=A0A397IHF6_9GLOM|nr:hypothetical protein Glove_232g74 [Diversispora epigaea]
MQTENPVELLFVSQEFIRSIEEPCSVNLRVVKSYQIDEVLDYSLNNRPRRQKKTRYQNNDSTQLQFRCYVLALALCYQL